MKTTKFLIFMLAIALFASCQKEEDVQLVIAKPHQTREAGTNVWGTQGCFINGKWGQKCIKNNAKDCKKEAACAAISKKVQDYLFERGIDEKQWESYVISEDRELLLLLWEENPELHFHPDSIPR